MLVGLERSKGKDALSKEEITEDSHKVSIQYFKQHQQHKKATKGVIRNEQKRSYLDTRINHIRDSKSVEASQEKQERSAKVEDSIRQSKALCKGKRRPYYCKNALN